VLDGDRDAIEEFNRRARPDFRIETDLLPEPFVGRLDAHVDLEQRLAEWEHFYNCDRPHGAFKGKTPHEVLRDRLQERGEGVSDEIRHITVKTLGRELPQRDPAKP